MKQTKKPPIAAVGSEEEREATVSVWMPSDGSGAFIEGAYNGVNFRIPTDTLIEVPAHIAAILKESRRTLLEGGSAVEAYRTAGGRKLG